MNPGAFALLSLLTLSAPATKAPSRLHVDVKSHDGTVVNVDLPLPVAQLFLAHAQSNADIDPADRKQLKEAWTALKESGQSTIDTRDARDTVHVRATGMRVVIDVIDNATGQTAVKLRLPGAAVDALLAGDRGLDLTGALAQLTSAGDFITVADHGDSVRIWLE